MPAVPFVQTQSAVQYDGTNSAEILDLFVTYHDIGNPSITYPPEIQSETGGVLTIHYDDDGVNSGPLNYPIAEGQWILAAGGPAVYDGVPLADMINP